MASKPLWVDIFIETNLLVKGGQSRIKRAAFAYKMKV